MKVLVLISGSLRTFRENIQRIPVEYDIAVYVSRCDEDTYLNPEGIRFLVDNPRIKTLVIEDTPTGDNTFKQWYKLQRLWDCVPKTYTVYVRMRPDIYLEDPDQLRRAVRYASVQFTIPFGSDRDGLNDQLAIGSYFSMNTYCSTVKELSKYPGQTSEYILGEVLAPYTIARPVIRYKLVLSSAKVVAIAGDSGSGKTSLCRILRPLFLFDKVLEFETDRYHKWERGDAHWEHTSHLDPNANYLEKLENDTFNLKIGKSVLAVDYDHSTGTFTPLQTVEPKENILLCGLHTMYSKQLRDLSDLKIYVDTSDELKKQWKLERDSAERNQDAQSILAKIESRKADYTLHVAPQKDHADIIIRFHGDCLSILAKRRELCVELSDPTIDVRKQLYEFLWSLDLPRIEAETGYNGVIQLTILRALYTKHG
jgi:uridine kinase